MTTLIINDQERHEIETSNEDSVLDVLVSAQDTYWNQNMSITGLAVNGEDVQPLNEATLMAIPAADLEINVKLEEVKERDIQETLGDAIAYMERLSEGFEELANAIRESNESSSYATLKDGIDGIMTILDLISAIGQNHEIPADFKGKYDSFLEDLTEKTQEMTEAQEGGDPTLTADIIEYEFADSAREIKSYLEDLKAFIKG